MRKLLLLPLLAVLCLPSLAAPIACVQNVTGSTCAAATSSLLNTVTSPGTFSFANTLGAGNMYILTIGTASTVTSVIGGGVDTFTQVGTVNDTQGDTEYIYVMCSGTGGYANVVVTLAGSTDLTAGGSEWSGGFGGATNACVDNVKLGTFTASTPLVITGPTQAVGNDLFISAAINSAGTAFTLPSGFTTSYLSTGTNEPNSSVYLISTDASAHSPSWAWAGGGDANGLAASFKPAAAGASGGGGMGGKTGGMGGKPGGIGGE